MTVTKRDIEIADQNWRAWQDVFEHVGPPQQNPLLTDAGRFADFLWEYGVGRTIRKRRHEELRILLGSPDFPLTMVLGDASWKFVGQGRSWPPLALRHTHSSWRPKHSLRAIQDRCFPRAALIQRVG